MARKLKLLPAPKNCAIPESYEYFVFKGNVYLYQTDSESCEVWLNNKKKGKKSEPLGIGWITKSGRWGIFCTRVPFPKLICVSKTLEDACEELWELFK